MLFKQIVALGLFLTASLAYALPYSIDTWKSKRGDFLYLINDAHIDTSVDGVIEANKQEAEYLLEYAQNKGILTLIENAFEYPEIQGLAPEQQAQINQYLKNRFETANLKQFVHLLKQGTVSNIINIEHRQFRAMGKKDPIAYQFDQLLAQIVIDEIKEYSDNELLNDYYQQLINSVEKNTTDDDYYDSELVDARILHMIYQYQCQEQNWFLQLIDTLKNFIFPSSKSIIVAAGGYHGDKIQELLPLLGYEKVSTIGKECIDTTTVNSIPDNYFVDKNYNVAVARLNLNTVLS